MAYLRTVKTASGATAVQIVWSSTKGPRDIEHLGSAHSDAEVEALKAAGRQRLAAGQGELDLGIQLPPAGGPLPITASRMGHLWDSLDAAYAALCFRPSRRRRGLQAAGACADRGTHLEVGRRPGAGRDRRARAVVPHDQAASEAVFGDRVP